MAVTPVLAAAYTRELAEARSWWKCANIADADPASPPERESKPVTGLKARWLLIMAGV